MLSQYWTNLVNCSPRMLDKITPVSLNMGILMKSVRLTNLEENKWKSCWEHFVSLVAQVMLFFRDPPGRSWWWDRTQYRIMRLQWTYETPIHSLSSYWRDFYVFSEGYFSSLEDNLTLGINGWVEDKFLDVINMRASQRLRFLEETTLPLSLQDSTILGVAIERLLYVGELTSQIINKAALLSVCSWVDWCPGISSREENDRSCQDKWRGQSLLEMWRP